MTPEDRKPIGVLGGSFDPIHIGHLQLARDAARQLRLAQVLFVPTGLAWQKGPATEATHRERMIERAIAGEPGFAIDRRELLRAGPTYTVDTLAELRAQVGPTRPLVLLIGADQFERLDTWHDWQQLIGLAHLGVAGRAGLVPNPPPALAQWHTLHLGSAAEVAQRPAGVVVAIAMQPVDCSSTRIRAMLHEATPGAGTPAAALLPPGVLDYIRRHRLYS
jgi:nicotinate-nucleotide adenylyltransferase